MKGWIKCLALLFGLSLHVAALAQSTFVPMVPVRLMDTRSGGMTVDGQFSGGGATSSTTLTVLGRAGIPTSSVSAVALNVTETDPGNFGYLVVWPTGTTQPLASNLNYVPGLSISNEVIAKIGSGGQVSIVSSGGSNIVVDVTGYFPTTSDLTSLTPARLLDTRPGMATVDGQYAGGGAIVPGATFDLPVVGRGGVPSSGVSAVVVNVTATQTTGPTYITVWPSGTLQPNASNLNAISAGQTIANLVMAAPGSNGKISIYNNYGNTHLIVDVVGYFSSTTTFGSLVPARILDTRPGFSTVDGAFAGQGAVGSGSTLDLSVLGRGGVPSSGVGAVALNLTAVTPTATGYVTAWGTGTTPGNVPPQAMALNFTAGSVIPSLVIVQVPASGKVSLYNSNGSTHLIADVVGWFPSAKLNYGVNVLAQAAGGNYATIPNYKLNPQLIRRQLKALSLSGGNTIRFFTAYSDSYYGAQAYNSNGTKAFSDVNDYLSTINQFLIDAKANGITNAIIVTNQGYSEGCVSFSTFSAGISLGGWYLDQLMSQVVNAPGNKPNIKIDLGNEIAPSNWEYPIDCTDSSWPSSQFPGGQSSSLTRKKYFISQFWSYYASKYPTNVATFSSILDASTDARIAGNRLNNLIIALNASGKPLPSWFAVHPYAANDQGQHTAEQAYEKMGGVYQIYSDYGFLSNGQSPKETIITEAFYEDIENANGINQYLVNVDGYNGGKIGLSGIIAWPNSPTVNAAVAYFPPYQATVYRDVIENHVTPISSPATPKSIISANSGKCVDVPGNSINNGVLLQQYTCNTAAQQKWVFISHNGYYVVVDAGTGAALDIAGQIASDGASIQQWEPNGTFQQDWSLIAYGSSYRLINRLSSKCLDVYNGQLTDGAPLQQWSCNGYLQQSWNLQ